MRIVVLNDRLRDGLRGRLRRRCFLRAAGRVGLEQRHENLLDPGEPVGEVDLGHRLRGEHARGAPDEVDQASKKPLTYTGPGR